MRIENTLQGLMRVVILLTALLAATGCGGTPTPVDDVGVTLEPRPMPTAVPTLPPPMPTTAPTAAPTAEPTPSLAPADAVNVLARRAVVALRDRDMAAIAAMIHPDQALLFSPEAYVDNGDLRFSAGQVEELMTDPVEYSWGHEAGSGLPIEMTFAEYYQEYVYDMDYAGAPQVAVDRRLGGAGGTLDNTQEFWPGSMFVEYYFPGTEQYGGLDWRSLRLVFQEVEGQWYLVAIVHDEWSP